MEMKQPHVLILPFPAQGHIKPMLCLAELLCHAGLHVTFVNTHHNHQRLTNLQALSTRFPTLHLESISDGLPEDNPHSQQRLAEFILSIKSVTKPHFRNLMLTLRQNFDERPPVTCIIADGVMSFAIDVAEEFGIKAIIFRTSSACTLWVYHCIPKLIEEGELPFGADDNMDQNVTSIPGMEGLLRRRDLPSICRSKQLDNPFLQFFINEAQAMARASSFILNTFDDLEAPAVSHIASFMSKIYTVGPLHAHLKSRVGDFPQSSSSTSLWRADYNCITWLDSQPLKSVIYVSFGSLVVMTSGQLLEVWHGLVNSGKPFLWVIRSDFIIGNEEENNVLPIELKAGTKERGCIVDWAPQEEVLAHPAVGGFLTHSGWNSTLEAIVAGVPLICWPQLGDQMINSRYVSEVWKIGVDMCDRSTVETMVRALMEDQREEIMKSMDRISGLAGDSVSPGGSSYHNLTQLIEDLQRL